MNNDLQPTARHIRWALERHASAIPLDRPEPQPETTEQANPVPPVPLRPPSPPPSSPSAPPPESQKPQVLEPQQGLEEPMTIAGYKPEELLTAPATPPQPIKTEKPSATRNNSVLFLVAIGILLAAIGIFLMFVTLPALGFVIMLLGAILVATSVFVPFRK
jgi:hypothetical protein